MLTQIWAIRISDTIVQSLVLTVSRPRHVQGLRRAKTGPSSRILRFSHPYPHHFSASRQRKQSLLSGTVAPRPARETPRQSIFPNDRSRARPSLSAFASHTARSLENHAAHCPLGSTAIWNVKLDPSCAGCAGFRTTWGPTLVEPPQGKTRSAFRSLLPRPPCRSGEAGGGGSSPTTNLTHHHQP